MTDREKIIRLIEEEISVCESVNQCYRTIDLPALRDILALLKEQEVVVRCKDCKHARIYENCVKCENAGNPGMFATYHQSDWFCADGKRRTD